MTKSTQAMKIAHIMFKANDKLISFGDCLVSAWRMVKRWGATTGDILAGTAFRVVTCHSHITESTAHDVYLYIEVSAWAKVKRACKGAMGALKGCFYKTYVIEV